MTFPEAGNAVITFANRTEAGPWTFRWDYGDGSEIFTTTSYADIIHEYTEPGNYEVTLYTNYGDCEASRTTTIIIKPRAPEAMFECNKLGCTPLTVQFTNNSLYATSYEWRFGDRGVSYDENPEFVFTQAGDWIVKLIARGPGGESESVDTVFVKQTPSAFFAYSPDDSVYVNESVQFFETSYFEDYYWWDFGDISEFDATIDEENNSTLANPAHTYRFEGWKDVKLVVWNDYCIDSILIPQAIKVVPAGILTFPTIFRPGDSPQTGVDVNNLSDDQMNTIFFPGINKQVQEYHMYIYNRWGELIFQSDDINVGWDGFVKGHRAPQGVYIWKVTGIYSNGSPFSDAGDVTLVWRQPGSE